MKKNQLGIAIKLIMTLSVATISQSALAVQALDDSSMSNVTGEGIAFVLDDFSMRFNGVDDGAGTGYSYVIPVGPLSDIISAHNAATACVNNASTCTAAEKSRARYNIQIGKADLYLYGLAISKNDNDVSTQFSNQNVNIGTADNPWLFQAKTVTTPNFKGDDDQLTYLGFEAPLLTGLTESNFNLKLGLWADAFVRDPSKPENDEAQFWLNSTNGTRPLSPTDSTPVTRENRLRLQAVMNGVSLNGTNLKIFQTLNGAESAAGLGIKYNYYNNTLGLAMTARINSGDSSTLKVGASSDSAITASSPTAWNGGGDGWKTIHTGENTGFDTTGNGGMAGTSCNNAGATNSAFNTGTGCQYQIRTRSRTDTKSQTRTWTLPTGLNNHVMRLSTQEKSDSPSANELLYTPARNSVQMPKFADTEGLFFYQPNINLVLGTQWQPLVLGVADDGKNFSLELTRIPNIPAVYQQIYTAYAGKTGGLTATEIAKYKGGTCSVYWCGDSSRNATHSSITIGTTNAYATDALGTGTLTAYKGSDSIGVSFGALQSSQTANSNPVTVNELQYKQRRLMPDNTWTSAYWCSIQALGCWGYDSGTGTLYQWQYNNGSGGYTTGTTVVTKPGNVSCSGNSCNSSSPSVTVGGYTYAACPTKADCTRYGTQSNRSWATNTTDSSWIKTTANSTVDSFIGGVNAGYGQTGVTYATNQATDPTPQLKATPLNNLGSAVIDGLLIQHFKITTKGL